MKIVYCDCGSLVRPARAEAGYSNCIRCAEENPVARPKGRMVYSHKCAPEIEILDAETYDANKKYFMPNGARSCIKNFSRNVCS